MGLCLYWTLSFSPRNHEPRAKSIVTHVSELNQALLSQLTDTIVGRAGLKEELHQAHLLTAKHGAHSCTKETNANE